MDSGLTEVPLPTTKHLQEGRNYGSSRTIKGVPGGNVDDPHKADQDICDLREAVQLRKV